MIKKEWVWMLNLPTNKKEIINQDNLQDGIHDVISTQNEKEYNDNDYDHKSLKTQLIPFCSYVVGGRMSR